MYCQPRILPKPTYSQLVAGLVCLSIFIFEIGISNSFARPFSWQEVGKKNLTQNPDKSNKAETETVPDANDQKNDAVIESTTAPPSDTVKLETDPDVVLQGHSYHGEAFNEGPRQKAYLMGGTGNVAFPVTTDFELAQKFINQGVGQLHGFWDLEAERSFRQAAAIDENCAMAYWGAAWASGANRKRAKGFIAKAVELKKKQQKTLSAREQKYIDALNKYLSDKPDDKEKRAAQYLKDLETIVIDHPNDLEAKAFVAHRVWHNARDGIPVGSYLGTDALMAQIFAEEPLHPANHYSIHLWDTRHPENALQAAARCGPAAPGIAHMWHMPGHIYSRLKRYEDAIYQQEASARVDHAHMMRDQIMPDEISNFAHNNEWLIRNLVNVGRVSDAIDLAKNMIELPRHPKYNTLEKKSGSASYGRRRLLQILREYEMWDEAIMYCRSNYLDTPDVPVMEKVKALRLWACSAEILKRSTEVERAAGDLRALHSQKLNEQEKLSIRVGRLSVGLDKSKDQPPVAKRMKVDAKKAKLQLKDKKKKLAEVDAEIDQIGKAKVAIEGYRLVAQQEFKSAAQQLKLATGEDETWIGELQFRGGDSDQGIAAIEKVLENRESELIPLARLAWLQHQNGDLDLAQKTFGRIRDCSSCMELELPILTRLKPIAESLELPDDWRKPFAPATDLGFRPKLESLGPFRWSPSLAPKWSLVDSNNQTMGSDEFRGQPHLIIFYLGHGCLHCAEQLQKFTPRVKDFEAIGIKVVAISTDNEAGLQESIASFADEIPMRLASDAKLDVFKQFRAHDDFEDLALHGTFLIDGDGKIRWQDISHEPFMEDDFLIQEAQRLLAGKNLADEHSPRPDPESGISKK